MMRRPRLKILDVTIAVLLVATALVGVHLPGRHSGRLRLTIPGDML